MADFLLNNAEKSIQGSEKAMGNGLLTVNGDTQGEFYSTISQACVADSVVDSLSSGVIFTDVSGILTYMNRAAETFLKVFKETVLGKRVDMLPLRTPLYKILSEDYRDFPVEMNIFGRVIEVRSSAVLSADNDMLGNIVELLDVSRERREKRNREEFVAKMTHDLKSPLMVMQGYIQAIRLGMLGEIEPKLAGTLADMERSGKNLHAMIEDLLDVYRLEMGLVQVRRKRCDIRRFLEECCRDRQLEVDEQGLTLVLKMCRSFPEAEFDEKQLSRVFANIIDNAVKFTPRHGKITVTAAVRRENLHVSVRDTGIGIEADDIPHIFNKYYRSEKAAGFKGSGLGLALSREIVEAHGGTITVKSLEGKGSTFTVIVPIHERN
ncbi:MAG: ATP-binding protein [Salinivirgaceae bacterium]|nr:ATP-binding protein [Salinivirgaceae bacterium]